MHIVTFQTPLVWITSVHVGRLWYRRGCSVGPGGIFFLPLILFLSCDSKVFHCIGRRPLFLRKHVHAIPLCRTLSCPPSFSIPVSSATHSNLRLGTAISWSYETVTTNFFFQIPYVASGRVSLQNLIVPLQKLYGIAGSGVFTSCLTASCSNHHCRHVKTYHMFGRRQRTKPERKKWGNHERGGTKARYWTFDIVVLKELMEYMDSRNICAHKVVANSTWLTKQNGSHWVP